MAGYIYVPLGLEGAFPYRDFSMPVTPLTWVFAQASDAIGTLHVLFAVAALPLAVLLPLSLYAMLRPLAPVRVSAILACLGSTALLTFRADTLGGWNLLTIVLTSTCAGMFIRSLHSDVRAWLWAGGAGVVGGLALLAKQTAVVPLLFAFVVLCVMCSRPGMRVAVPSLPSALLTALLGFVFVLSCFTGWLVANEALGAFIDDMRAMGGKNPSAGGGVAILLRSLDQLFTPATAAVILTVVSWQLADGRGIARLSSDPRGRIALALLYGLTLGLLFQVLLPELALGAAAGFVTTVGLLIHARHRDPFATQPSPKLWFALVAIPLEFAIVWRLLVSGPERPSPLEQVWVALVLWAAALVAIQPRGALTATLASEELSQEGRVLIGPVMGLSSALTLGWWVVVVQSTASTVPAAFLLPTAMPLVAGLVLSLGALGFRLSRRVVLLGALATSAVFVVTAWAAPYVWNGWHQPSIFGNYARVREGPLAGMPGRDRMVELYNRLGSSIAEAARRTATERSTLFAFGNYPVAYALSDLSAYRNMRCPNHWVDLCPEDVSIGDIQRFSDQPPDVVVWAEIPESELEYQESSFGSFAYRAWEEFRDTQVASGAWVEVDRIPSSDEVPNNYQLMVYAVPGA